MTGARRALTLTFALALAVAVAGGASPAWANIYVNPQGTDLESAALDGTNFHYVSPPTGLNRLTPDGGVASDGAHLYLGYRGSDEVGAEGLDRVGIDGTGLKRRFVRARIPGCDDDIGGVPDEAAIAVQGSVIYWADPLAGTIGRANVADGSGVDPQFIVAAAGPCSPIPGMGPEGLAVDGSHIYWSNPEQGTIGRANLDGSGVVQSFISGVASPWGVAVSGPNVYWSSATAGAIGHAQLDASGALVPASVNNSFITGLTPTDAGAGPAAIAAQGSSLYFDNGDGWIGNAATDGTTVNHHLLHAYDDNAGRPAPAAIAADGAQPSATRTSLACGSGSVHYLQPRAEGLAAPVGNATGCTVFVDHVGPSPAPVRGGVQISATPVTGGIVSISGGLIPVGSCLLKPSAKAGQSSCTFEYAADATVHGFDGHASHVTLKAAYVGETTHRPSTGTERLNVTRVHACLRTGDQFQQTCNAQGEIQSVTGVAVKGATRVDTYPLFGGGLNVARPRPCVRVGRRFTVALTFGPGKGSDLRLRRVALALVGQQVTLSHAPFTARLRMGGRTAALTAHLDFASPPTVDTHITVKLAPPAC